MLLSRQVCKLIIVYTWYTASFVIWLHYFRVMYTLHTIYLGLVNDWQHVMSHFCFSSLFDSKRSFLSWHHWNELQKNPVNGGRNTQVLQILLKYSNLILLFLSVAWPNVVIYVRSLFLWWLDYRLWELPFALRVKSQVEIPIDFGDWTMTVDWSWTLIQSTFPCCTIIVKSKHFWRRKICAAIIFIIGK